MSKTIQIKIPTDEEDAAITRAALSDPDAQPLSEEELRNFKPVRLRDRPPGTSNKVLVSVRYDADVVGAFKSTGDGWQTLMNEVLRSYAKKKKMLETH